MSKSIFIVNPLKDVICDSDNQKPPKRLWGPFFHEGEINILFADTNQGKTLLANDIAFGICNGNDFGWQYDPLFEKHCGVMIIDFELSSIQVAARYGVSLGKVLPDDLIRVELNQKELYRNIDEEMILDEIEKLVIKYPNVDVLIIDNISYIANSASAKKAVDFMKGLKRLKEKYEKSILVLAHTPKRNLSKPITQNDLQGSKALINYCDSAMALGESAIGSDVKYLKHIKARSCKLQENVCRLRISQSPYLHFIFESFDQEDDHLEKRKSFSQITPEIGKKIADLKDEEYSIREIAQKLGFSKSTIGRYVKGNCNPE